MKRKEAIDKLEKMEFEKGSFYNCIKELIFDSVFDRPIKTKDESGEDLINKIRENFGRRPKSAIIQTYMKPFLEAKIIRGIKIKGQRGNWWCGTWVKDDLLAQPQLIGVRIFSESLIKKLGKDFEQETKDIHLVYGRSGDCTAFLLRKILEKAIFLSFAKHGKEDKLIDPARKGRYLGLQSMMGVASKEKVNGKPFLLPKTAEELNGIKFLGDTASHNFLINVKMEKIVPQLPIIQVALEELTKKL